MVPGFPPLGNSLTVEDEDVEEGIKEENVGGLDRSGVQQHWLSTLLLQRVRIKSGLDHDERVTSILVVQDVAVESSLIGRVVENLQELTSAKMEHELRVQSEVLFQSE